MHLREPTDITDEIMKAAMELFRDNYDWSHPIRSLGVRGADLVTADIPVQMSLFMNEERCASRKAGGTGIMYTVVVAGKECHLYFEFDKWFMERKIA